MYNLFYIFLFFTNQFVFSSSFVASLGSAIASTPIDVVRTRVMNQRYITTTVVNEMLTSSKRNIYTSSLDCAVQVSFELKS